MVRGPEEFAAAAAPYVCVLVTDMAGVDLNLIRFDFDLTLAVVLMHADGTVYHRYGSRDGGDPLSWMSTPSLVRLLKDSLEDHADYRRAPAPPAVRVPLRPVDLPPLEQKIDGGQKVECVHCHTIHETEHVWALQEGRVGPDLHWVYPDPVRIGLRLDADEQDRVREVLADSAAVRAGLRQGDRLLSMGVQRRVRTIADVSWALHHAAAEATRLGVTFTRGGDLHAVELALPEGWKRCTPEEYAWRPYKWNLSPAPGFGGPALGDADKEQLGIARDKFAFRVQYLVTWGERAHRGRAAAKAGVRKDDVVVSFAGKDDFVSVDHFHAWVRLTRKAGETVEVVVLRGGERRVLRFVLPE